MMATAQSLDFAALAPAIAARLFDKPNKAMSSATDLRFGTHGSMSINIETGQFFDHEQKAGGGMLDLIQRVRGCDVAGALAWLEDEGFKDREPHQAEVWQLGAHRAGPVFYDYRDERGQILSRVRRTPDKRFVQLGPDGKGGFHSAKDCMKGVRRVPYRLPELLAADPSKIIFVVEGEKDADRLAGLGLVATTNSEGAGKFRTDLVQHFAGRRVAIIADNDTAGRDHATDVVAKLQGVADAVGIVTLPGLPEKGDVSDWLNAGGTVDQLIGQYAEPALSVEQAGPEPLPLIDPFSFDGVETPAREWSLKDWIPRGQATYLTGPGSAGKSLVTQQLCTCIALGLPFMGIETSQAVAIYVTCEDDEDELHRRQKAICASLGVRLSDLSGKLHLVSLMGELGNELITFDDRDRATPTPRFQQLVATARQTKAGFVAVDNVAHLTSDEIARNKVAAFVNMLNRMARDMTGSVLFLGHPNKAGDAYSGSTAWENQVRSRLFLETPKESDGTIPDPDVRVLSRGKANYARNGETVAFRWHQWAFVRPEDMPANIGAEIAANAQANAENERFLACLAERTRQKRAVSEKTSKTYAPTVFASMAEAKGSSKRAMELAMDRLFRIGRIERAEVWRGEDRKPVFGLRETPAGVREMGAGNVQKMSAGDCGKSAGMAREIGGQHTPLYTTYIEGAAPSGPAAPSPDATEESWHANPALGRDKKIETRFPPPSRADNGVDLSRTVFPATDDERASILRSLTDPLPEHLRDPFNPQDWPEEE